MGTKGLGPSSRPGQHLLGALARRYARSVQKISIISVACRLDFASRLAWLRGSSRWSRPEPVRNLRGERQGLGTAYERSREGRLAQCIPNFPLDVLCTNPEADIVDQ